MKNRKKSGLKNQPNLTFDKEPDNFKQPSSSEWLLFICLQVCDKSSLMLSFTLIHLYIVLKLTPYSSHLKLLKNLLFQLSAERAEE